MNKSRLYVEFGLALALLVSLSLNFWLVLKSEVIVGGCKDFESQKAAQEALGMGNTSLDADEDGVACESLI